MSILETNQPGAEESRSARWLIVAFVAGFLLFGVALALRAGQSDSAIPGAAVPVATAAAIATAVPVPTTAPAAAAVAPVSAVASPTATSDQTSNMGYLEQLTHEQDFCNCGH